MSFRDSLAADNQRTFLNLEEFAELRAVYYDGEAFLGADGSGIPVVLSALDQRPRRQLTNDYMQGVYEVKTVLHCRSEDLGGLQPERGTTIEIAEPTTPDVTHKYRVAESKCEFGFLRCDLEAYDE